MRVIIRKEMRKFWILISTVLLLVPLLTGCWDSNEPDRMLYAQGLGVDYKNGKYIVYIQLINLSLLAKVESGAGTGKQYKTDIGQATGFSVEDAIFNLYKTSQRRIHWGHLTYVFLTNNALKNNGLQDVTDMIDRFFETHYRMWIYSTDAPLTKVLNTDPPINMSTYLSRLSDPEAAFDQFSFIQSLDMREVLISHYEPPNEIILPVVGYNNKDWKGDDKTRNIGVIKGISIIANNTLKGSIINKDVNGFRWMEKEFRRTGLSIPFQENRTVGLIVAKRKVRIEPIMKNGKVQFDIHIKIKAVISKLESHVPLSQISLETSKIIKKEVHDTFNKGLEIDADVYRLSHALYQKNYPVWKKIQQDGKIPLTEDSIRKINVEVMIVNGGKQRKIPTLKN